MVPKASGEFNNKSVNLNTLLYYKYPLSLLIPVMSAQVIMPIVIMIVLMNNPDYIKIIALLNSWTGGFIIPTIANYLIFFSVLILIFYFWPGKINFTAIGLNKSKIFPAFVITFAIWIIPQILILGYSLISGNSLNISEFWTKYGLMTGSGILFGQFFGNALYEEIVFRGFLIPQFYQRLTNLKDKIRLKPLILSIFYSQLFFALIHIPNRIFNGETNIVKLILYLLPLLLIGVFFSIMYLRTQNLFLCIGIHSLINYQGFIINAPIEPQSIIIILAMMLTIFYPQIRKYFVEKVVMRISRIET